MQQPAAGGDPLRRLAIEAGRYAGVFAAGALLAFLYSYQPLHSAKNWKIDYLEERLAAKDAELGELREAHRVLEADSSGRPEAAEVEVLRAEVATANKTVERLEQQLERLDRRAREAEQTRDQWKSRLAELERTRAATPAAVARRSLPSEPEASAPGPAAPAPEAAAAEASTAPARSATSIVRIGTRWRSADGRSDFDLVAVEGGRARVVPDASALRPGVVPAPLSIGAGEHFEVAAPGDTRRLVLVRSVDATSGIEIEIAD